MVELAEHHKRLAAYYGPLLAEHGNHYRGVGWVAEHLQSVRFEVLSAVGDLRHASILDVGCGVGHLLDWLTARGYDGAYTGIEVQEEMAARACAIHPEAEFPNARFECGEFLAMGRGFRADYVLASGIFPLDDMDIL